MKGWRGKQTLGANVLEGSLPTQFEPQMSVSSRHTLLSRLACHARLGLWLAAQRHMGYTYGKNPQCGTA